MKLQKKSGDFSNFFLQKRKYPPITNSKLFKDTPFYSFSRLFHMKFYIFNLYTQNKKLSICTNLF